MKVSYQRIIKFVLTSFLLLSLIACQKDTVNPISGTGSSGQTKQATKSDTSQTSAKTSSGKESNKSTSTDTAQTNRKTDTKSQASSNKKDSSSSSEAKKGTATQKSTSSIKSSSVTTKKTVSTTSSSSSIPKTTKSNTTKNTTSSNHSKSSTSSTSTTSSSGKTTTKTSTGPQVTISIIGYNNQVILPPTKVNLKEGETFLDVTLSLLKAKGIQSSVSGTGATAYVQGIDNLYEFDHGPKSGWVAKLDQQSLTKSAGITAIKSGDVLQWIYTTTGE